MIKDMRDWKPCGHISPRPRIDLNPPRPAIPGFLRPVASILELLEQDRIWKLVVEVSR